MLSRVAPSLLSPMSMASPMRGGVARMGFAPSPKELSDDPSIEDVLKVCKAEQAERFARANMNGAAYAVTMPGVVAPFGFFDPLELVPQDQDQIRMYREAELVHGRVCMMAAVGFLVQENFHPIFSSAGGPVIHQLDLVLKSSLGQLGASCLLLAIFFSGIYRARVGWKELEVAQWELRSNYKMGNLGFDPLGYSAKMDQTAFLAMQNKELNNGRLAMIGVAGMTAQELVTDAPLFA